MIDPENITHHEDGSVTLTPAGVAQVEKAWAELCRSIERANEALFPALTIAQSWAKEIIGQRPSPKDLIAALHLARHPGPLPVPPYDRAALS